MNLSTYKIRIKNENVKEDNILLAIHSPLEVFYLSCLESALKDIPQDIRKDYLITESDFFDGEMFITHEEVICTLNEVFDAKDFKDFCYKIHLYTSKPADYEFYNVNVMRLLPLEDVEEKEIIDSEEI